MNGVCGFREGFVGGCEGGVRDVKWEDMRAMGDGGRGNEGWRWLERILSMLER